MKCNCGRWTNYLPECSFCLQEGIKNVLRKRRRVSKGTKTTRRNVSTKGTRATSSRT